MVKPCPSNHLSVDSALFIFPSSVSLQSTFPFHFYFLHLQKSTEACIKGLFYIQSRDLSVASEAASLLIEVDLQGPFPLRVKYTKSCVTVATGILPY